MYMSVCWYVHNGGPFVPLDPFYWAWLPMAKTPFSNDTSILVLDKLKDQEFVQSLVDDLRRLFKVRDYKQTDIHCTCTAYSSVCVYVWMTCTRKLLEFANCLELLNITHNHVCVRLSDH